VAFVCLILIALGCHRNGYKCRGYIMVEVVGSPSIIERAIGHEVNNEIDIKCGATASSLDMSRSESSSYSDQRDRRLSVGLCIVHEDIACKAAHHANS